MININIDVNGLDKLQQRIEQIKKFSKMKTDFKFQEFIRNKCLYKVKEVAKLLLSQATTTNEEYYEEYLASINIPSDRIKKDGFEIVSNLVIEKPASRVSEAYNFSISMAFEYGTGITGMGSADAPSSYQYYMNKNTVIVNDEKTEGWWIPIDKNGNNPIFGVSKSGKAVVTQGYEGLEIFRNSAIQIQKSLNEWVEEYFKNEGGTTND